MLDPHDDRTITALVDEVLLTLRANLQEHQEIVAEAKAGYLRSAQEALQTRLARLQMAEIVDLSFNLYPPKDYTRDFNTVIKMLELHKAAWESNPANAKIPATIAMKAADVNRFVLNVWTWSKDFLVLNSTYSGKAMSKLRSE